MQPASGPIQYVQAHDPECLDVDWNKYDDHMLATGGVDGVVRVWDRRKMVAPVYRAGRVNEVTACAKEILGHRFAVKRVRYVNQKK
jgi:peroxin-7